MSNSNATQPTIQQPASCYVVTTKSFGPNPFYTSAITDTDVVHPFLNATTELVHLYILGMDKATQPRPCMVKLLTRSQPHDFHYGHGVGHATVQLKYNDATIGIRTFVLSFYYPAGANYNRAVARQMWAYEHQAISFMQCVKRDNSGSFDHFLPRFAKLSGAKANQAVGVCFVGTEASKDIEPCYFTLLEVSPDLGQCEMEPFWREESLSFAGKKVYRFNGDMPAAVIEFAKHQKAIYDTFNDAVQSVAGTPSSGNTRRFASNLTIGSIRYNHDRHAWQLGPLPAFASEKSIPGNSEISEGPFTDVWQWYLARIERIKNKALLQGGHVRSLQGKREESPALSEVPGLVEDCEPDFSTMSFGDGAYAHASTSGLPEFLSFDTLSENSGDSELYLTGRGRNVMLGPAASPQSGIAQEYLQSLGKSEEEVKKWNRAYDLADSLIEIITNFQRYENEAGEKAGGTHGVVLQPHEGWDGSSMPLLDSFRWQDSDKTRPSSLPWVTAPGWHLAEVVPDWRLRLSPRFLRRPDVPRHSRAERGWYRDLVDNIEDLFPSLPKDSPELLGQYGSDKCRKALFYWSTSLRQVYHREMHSGTKNIWQVKNLHRRLQ
ncbi:hypothetical protein BJ508DRAFT_53607 [Ascobolus immersus RN42]|uniref:Uncharacterized protein n=1 Tax=Ascobolus immersus RN42 TaxID=1160509 RepID=A0A3N4HMD1_ASCIM|nr:hypothetical protein BJ508DRAFT_53607 [Ascobolus immersus RN42]